MKIGIDVGGTHIGVGVLDKKNNLVLKSEKNYDEKVKDMSNIVENTILYEVNKIIKSANIDKNQIESIGIAFPGTVTADTVIKAENLGITNFKIGKKIKDYFNIPVKLENDAKCAAIAEKEFGVLKDYEDSIFLIVGTGVGGAVFLNNQLLRPKRYSGFEVGHVVINKNGNMCNCGRRGCFETYASMHTLKQKIRDEFNMQGTDGKQIKEFIFKNIKNLKLNSIIDEYIENLSIGITNLINIFEPQVICIGGGFRTL